MKTIVYSLRAAIPVMLAAGIWYGLALVVESIRGVDFPTPLDTARRLWDLFAGHTLSSHLIYRHIGDSLVRWTAGFGIAAAAGVAAGLAAGWWRRLQQVLAPLLHVLQLIPGLAWIPVALLLFGVGESATIAMIIAKDAA